MLRGDHPRAPVPRNETGLRNLPEWVWQGWGRRREGRWRLEDFDGVGQATGRAGDRGKGYYAFDLGAWRLYALNSNCANRSAPGCAESSPQLQWLRADLAAHPRRCSLAFMHHPMFTSDTRDFDSPAFRDKLRPLWQAFYDHGGDVVLVGHSHFYERYAPRIFGLFRQMG